MAASPACGAPIISIEKRVERARDLDTAIGACGNPHQDLYLLQKAG
jgi:hypothetical protein